MRLKASVLAGAVLAVTLLPAAPASASCDLRWHELTGDCSPCHTLQRLGYPVSCPRS